MSSINARVPPTRIAAIDSPADGEVAAYQASSGQFEWVANGSGGGGTVTSVALTETGSALSISGSPITGSGTFNISGAGTSSQVILGDLTLGTLTSGTVTGTGLANQVSYWTSTTAQAGSTGLTYDPSTGDLTVGGYVETGTKVTTPSGTNLTLDTNNGTDSGSIVISNGVNGQISITPNGTGTIKLDGVELDNSAIATGYVLKATSTTEAGWSAESSGGSPGGSNNEIQFNNSGAFGGDAGFLMNVKGDGSSTKIQVGNILMGANLGVGTAATNGTVYIQSDGTGQIFLTSGNDSGGTFTDTIVNVNCNAGSDNSILRFRDNSSSKEAEIKLDDSSNLDIDNNNTDKNIELSVKGTGSVQLKNATTNNASTLIVRGNGTGDSIINLTNDTKAVTLKCDENQKIKVDGGGGYSFVLDASSATSGITFPDGTTQITAASTNNFDVLIPAIMPALYNTRFIISQLPTWGSTDKSETSNGSVGNRPMCFPFISPKSGDVDEIGINITSSAASGNIYVALYDSDTNGYADSLLGYATLAATSTGSIYQTSLSATPTLVRGRQYWYSFNVDSAIAPFYMAASTETVPGVGTGNDVTQNAVCFYDQTATAYAAPPASFTNSYSYGGYNRPLCSLKIS